MPRGGKRPGAGRPRKPKLPPVGDKNAAGRLLEALNRPARDDDSYEVTKFRRIDDAGVEESIQLRRWLYDKRDGQAVRIVNHLHDKPLEMTVTHTLSERFKIALEKAEQRVRRNG